MVFCLLALALCVAGWATYFLGTSFDQYAGTARWIVLTIFVIAVVTLGYWTIKVFRKEVAAARKRQMHVTVWDALGALAGGAVLYYCVRELFYYFTGHRDYHALPPVTFCWTTLALLAGAAIRLAELRRAR